MYNLDQTLAGFSFKVILIIVISDDFLHYRMFVHHLGRLTVHFQSSYGK